MKEKNVIDFYLVCNRLKSVIRTGWKEWHVKKERLESIAEHIYGVEMLAIAIKSEYQYDIDILKVIYMLAIHELGECIIGDITMFDDDASQKEELEHKAVHSILDKLIDGEEIEKLFLEFDEKETKEAKFAYCCDKLECDIQSKLYDKYVDLNSIENSDIINKANVSDLIESGKSFSDMWLYFGRCRYPYDDNFMAISNYVSDNDIEGDL